MPYTCPTCGMYVSDYVTHLCQGYRTVPTYSTTTTTYLDPAVVERIAKALESIAEALKPGKKAVKRRG